MVVAEIVNAEDVLVRDLPREEELLLEAPFEVRAAGDRREDLRSNHLERDRDAELLVLRLVDRAHAADAQQALDAVAAGESIARRECRRRARTRGEHRAGASHPERRPFQLDGGGRQRPRALSRVNRPNPSRTVP